VPLLYQEVQSGSKSYRNIVLEQINAKTLADSTVQYRFCIVHVETSHVTNIVNEYLVFSTMY
jgi:hypothetical protein